jgi:N-(5'phosphoribosyl)anthranilate (PRA) isomerase
MKISKVTITGADDNTSIKEMTEISKQFPFVEWGILFSPKRVGEERYPSVSWLHDLITADPMLLTLSAHLCGGYTREMLVAGSDYLVMQNLAAELGSFSRKQLNFNASRHGADFDAFFYLLGRKPGVNFILQMNTANKAICQEAIKRQCKNVSFLYDSSGGRGTLASEWKAPIPGFFTGYAGGLSPENLAAELETIEKVAGDETIWIDTESRVRTDGKLDMNKVKQFLSIAEKYTK